ncbi:MaoC family dehydratase [Halostella sp. JP-L12]|uniref:MaoC family dehydratase n=1 Tax=Halostella TaxID=1843185 RepID=UPI000EF7AB45|nr:MULTISPECIES: MaoC family dehydratase [Halostella]NHN47199.1 MaoC family dehydratase [Halostella sp. JP-L12]
MPVADPGDTATAELSVTQRRIDAFASVTGDDNPLHLDPGYAADSVFDGQVAHGMLSAGAISSALADLPGDIVYVDQDLSFERPVRPGQTVEATVTVAETDEEDQLRVETTAATEDGPVVTGTATVLSLPHGQASAGD